MNNAPLKHYYDIEQLKAVSILDAARMLNLPVESRGGTYRTKIRSERTASVVLHPPGDGRYPNSFHDFGSNQHGDVIDLVATVQRISRPEAMQVLANAFGIEPIDPRAGMNPNDLTFREYEKIGLYGDRATKNFTFDPDRQSIERIAELSEKYGMPMNELRKNHPKVYAQIIRDKAIPHVRSLRNAYYFDVLCKYNFFKNMDVAHLFYNPSTITWFKEHHIDALNIAERLLNRACKDTTIRAREPGEYDPIKDLQKIQRGELTPTITPEDYGTMQQAAKARGTNVKYQTVDFGKYLVAPEELESFTHSAYLKEGNVVIGYLEDDREALRPIFDQMRLEPKKDLDQQIDQAKAKQEPAPAAGKAPEKNTPTQGEER